MTRLKTLPFIFLSISLAILTANETLLSQPQRLNLRDDGSHSNDSAELATNFVVAQTLPQSQVEVDGQSASEQDMLTYPISVQLPQAAQFALYRKIKNCRIAKLREDSTHPTYHSFFKCDLNNDLKPDFALVAVAGNDSTLTEYYVALVSSNDTYQAFIVRSDNITGCDIDEYSMSIEPKGTEIAAFDGPDSEVKWKPSKDGSGISFDVDCILIGSLVNNSCQSFVFQNGRFHSFLSCD